MTEAERRIWQILRSEQMQGHKFRRQVPIGRYIADFVCPQGPLGQLKSMAASTSARHCGRLGEAHFCNTRDIAFYGSGTTRC